VFPSPDGSQKGTARDFGIDGNPDWLFPAIEEHRTLLDERELLTLEASNSIENPNPDGPSPRLPRAVSGCNAWN
jgi:hypothetical protein